MSHRPTPDILFRNLRLGDGSPSAIAVSEGRIAAIGVDAKAGPATNVIDLGEALTLPGFVEGHIHLDTSFYGDTWQSHVPCTAGFDVRERVAIQHRNLASAAPMNQRARNQLELCIINGSIEMRSHVMVDAGETTHSIPPRQMYRARRRVAEVIAALSP
jgi:cytosine deaminase